MIVDTNAYIMSFVTIIVGFLIRDFLIPLFVWRKYLKDKSYSYRFWFCVITQAAFLINLVLLLGFFDICNRYTVLGGMALIYGLISWNFSDKRFFQRCRQYPDILWAIYKKEKFILQACRGLAKYCRDSWKTFWHWPIHQYSRKHWLEAVLLGAVVIYNLWFLTHNVMLYHSYHASDIPVHQSWIYALEQGTLFSDGIYPFGMHAMIYILRIMFGFNLREILLYAGIYQTILLVIGLYLLSKEIFCAKYSPLAVVTIFSLLLNQNRYYLSLPQEAGMYAVIGLAYFFLRYLHSDRKKFTIDGDSRLRRFVRINAYINRRYINSELILLMLCVALVIAYHFYTAIAAVILILAIGLSYLSMILKKQYFIPLMFSGFMGVLIAVLPFVACLAKGIEFEGSIEWATSVIAGEERADSIAEYESKLAETQGLEDFDAGTIEPEAEVKEEPAEENIGMSTEEKIRYYFQVISQVKIYGKDVSLPIPIFMLAGFICATFMLIPRKIRIYAHDYHAIIINMVILCTLAAAEPLGLIELIETARIATFAAPYFGLIFMLPVDFVFRILGLWKNHYYQALLRGLSLAVCCSAVVLIVELGWYHNFFEVYPLYYNETEYALRHIKQSYEKNTYTVVSPADEYLELLDYGYHTELSEFLNMVNGKQPEFTIPSQYVFFFIEKQIIDDIKYKSVKVDLEYAAMDFQYTSSSLDYVYARAIIESQAYYWAQKFKKMYPRNFKTYYEDDNYVIYLMEQNTYVPYSLKINYLEDYADVIEANGWNTEERTNAK